MKLTVCTDAEVIKNSFFLSDGFSIEFHSVTQVLKLSKTGEPGDFLFIDVSRLDPERSVKIIKSLCGRKDLYIGVIDVKRRIHDVGSLFHQGIVDYIGKDILENPVTGVRIENILKFKKMREFECPEPEEEQIFAHPVKNYKHVQPDWSNVEPGAEYTFLFVHVCYDNFSEIASNYTREHAVKMVNRMNGYLSSVIQEYNGLLWMRMERCALMLFPFDRRGIHQLELLFKLMLNRKIITLEQGFRNELSYHFSLHLGNTVYEEPGNTGSVVSETVNAIFHLGNKYTASKSIFMTQELRPFVPDSLTNLLYDAGVYEGRDISGLKLPRI